MSELLEWKDLTRTIKHSILNSYQKKKLSSGVIVERIRLEHGYIVSRNVVIGHYSRNKIPLPGARDPNVKRRPSTRDYRATAKRKIVVDKPLDTSNRVRFLDISEGQCKWPVSNDQPGPDMIMCGNPVTWVGMEESETPGPYCTHHKNKSRRGEQHGQKAKHIPTHYTLK